MAEKPFRFDVTDARVRTLLKLLDTDPDNVDRPKWTRELEAELKKLRGKTN